MVEKIERSKEIFDIWFEVGCSQYAVLENQLDNNFEALEGNNKEIVSTPSNNKKTQKSFDIDLIVEGKDQCECWLMGLALVNRNNYFPLFLVCF